MKLFRFFVEEWILSLSILGFILTEVLNPRLPQYSESDFKVLFTLFVFLILIKGLSESNFLKFLAFKAESGKFIGHKLVLFTALISMFLTNDVALFVIVPVTFLLRVENVERLVILEIAAANGGSSLTPFGNPQNIYIYYHYHLHFLEFMRTIFPFTLLSVLIVLLLTPKLNLKSVGKAPAYRRETYILLTLFFIFVLSVLKFLPLWTGVLIPAYALFRNRELLKVDYPLLLTFFFFFGFTDNLSHILNVKLDTPKEVFLYSVLGSQVMSNVPAALFFGDFTENWRALLWGVSVGGFGTLVSSLANLIGYRLYYQKFGRKKEFLIKFHLINFLLLSAGILLFFCLSQLRI